MSDDQHGQINDGIQQHEDLANSDAPAVGDAVSPDRASPESTNASTNSPTPPAMTTTTPKDDSAASTGSGGGEVEAESDFGVGSGGGILKASRSSSHLASETNTSGQPRQSAIRRSLSHHLKRVSIAGDTLHHHERERLLGNDGATIDDGDADGEASAASPVTFLARRRSTAHSGYGSIYPSMYRKLSTLHRLSFADVVERIMLTFENINVYAPAGGGKSGGGSEDKTVLKKGLSASAEANVVHLKQKHILKDGL